MANVASNPNKSLIFQLRFMLAFIAGSALLQTPVHPHTHEGDTWWDAGLPDRLVRTTRLPFCFPPHPLEKSGPDLADV